jgi:hypothetical protein
LLFSKQDTLGVIEMKKKWSKPELIVLYRGKPDENLMQQTSCKFNPKNTPDNAAGLYCEWEHGGRAGIPCYTYSTS